jgi:hypothetical protein
MAEARAFYRLRLRRLSVAEIARRTGYRASRVSARLLPEEVQEMVATHDLAIADAVDLARELRATGMVAALAVALLVPG